MGINQLDLRFLTNEEIRKYEPYVSPKVLGAIYESAGGNINPKRMLKEVGKLAIAQGIKIDLGQTVTNIQYQNSSNTYRVYTTLERCYET